MMALRRPFLIGPGPLREENRQHREAENGGADISPAPAEVALHRQERGGRDRGAENPGEGVEREDVPEPRRRAVMREERIVGRVIDRVAETGDRVHGDEHGERMDKSRDRKGDGAEGDAGDQHEARAIAVDQKAGGGL